MEMEIKQKWKKCDNLGSWLMHCTKFWDFIDEIKKILDVFSFNFGIFRILFIIYFFEIFKKKSNILRPSPWGPHEFFEISIFVNKIFQIFN